jgi:hypothetical protein
MGKFYHTDYGDAVTLEMSCPKALRAAVGVHAG